MFPWRAAVLSVRSVIPALLPSPPLWAPNSQQQCYHHHQSQQQHCLDTQQQQKEHRQQQQHCAHQQHCGHHQHQEDKRHQPQQQLEGYQEEHRSRGPVEHLQEASKNTACQSTIQEKRSWTDGLAEASAVAVTASASDFPSDRSAACSIAENRDPSCACKEACLFPFALERRRQQHAQDSCERQPLSGRRCNSDEVARFPATRLAADIHSSNAEHIAKTEAAEVAGATATKTDNKDRKTDRKTSDSPAYVPQHQHQCLRKSYNEREGTKQCNGDGSTALARPLSFPRRANQEPVKTQTSYATHGTRQKSSRSAWLTEKQRTTGSSRIKYEKKSASKCSNHGGRHYSRILRKRKRRRNTSDSDNSSNSSTSGDTSSGSSSDRCELLQVLSQRRCKRASNARCWTSGSSAVDELLGQTGTSDSGWRRRDIVEIYGPGGGAALTEILLTCMAESLFASQRGRVLLLSFRGSLPLRRLQQLLRYKVIKRMQQRLQKAKQLRRNLCQHHQKQQQQGESQKQGKERQQHLHHSERRQENQSQHEVENEHIFYVAAERRVQRLLRRVHVAHCFTLQDFGEALNQAEDVFAVYRAAAVVNRKETTRRAMEAERRRRAAEAGEVFPACGASEEASAAARGSDEKEKRRRCKSRSSCEKAHCGLPSQPSSVNGTGAKGSPSVTHTVDTLTTSAPFSVSSATHSGEVVVNHSGEATDTFRNSSVQGRHANIASATDSHRHKSRTRHASFARSSDSCHRSRMREKYCSVRVPHKSVPSSYSSNSATSSFLAVAAIDGLPLLLLPFALLEGNGTHGGCD